MIAVSGASGRIGGKVIEILQERGSARLVALTRTPERLAGMGVVARAADFDDPDRLVKALDGVERMLLVSTDAVGPGGRRIRQQSNAVRAAIAAGVGHVIYTSFTRVGDVANPLAVAEDHRATEHALATSGMAFTSLRHNTYTEMLLMRTPEALSSGVLKDNSGDGATGYVTRDDCAEVAATLLAEGGHEGEFLEVTGPEALTQHEVAALLADITGRPVRFQPQCDDEAVSDLVKRGMTIPMAQFLTTFAQAGREGFKDTVTDVVERLAGRKPTSVADFLRANRAALHGT
ncbi:SDR family oxidoreductase [Streptomyces sp. 3211]|uniref:SDR family oxidoreductase n=1 Tax=Streptomyces sp. 3211 TaxID=1964449 RepID=UPI0021501D1B|nr:SDR family oxidoreductase [Streptomyces sp. 3211]